MNVTLAKTAGFCFGVKRAVNMVYEAIEKKNDNKPIYTYGPIIHNDEVVKDLESKGVVVVKNLDEISNLEPGVMIIRSHGISRNEMKIIEAAGFEVISATCPFVTKIHKLVSDYSSNNHEILIIGNEKHPEVQGIVGWVNGEHVSVVSDYQQAEGFSSKTNLPICIVAQTTFNYKKFQDIVEIITKKGYNIIVLNTICNATSERQTEAREIAKNNDAMIVIGDKNSSNTQKLFEICKNECENTYYIQTSNDMDYSKIRSINNVGITAGASTPNNIIEEVSKNVRNEL